MNYLTPLFLCACLCAGAWAQPQAPREKFLLQHDWKFYLGDAPDAVPEFNWPEEKNLSKAERDDDAQEAALASRRVDAAANNVGAGVSFLQGGFDDNGWKNVDVPHDWVVELPFAEDDGHVWKDKPGSWAHVVHGSRAFAGKFGNTIGWYRKQFEIPAADKGRALWLEFDGVHRNALIWLNGKCLGRNVSGVIGNVYDVSDAINYGGKNTLVVRVDASRYEGWYYEGAGIYRPVWLIKSGPVHVAPWGTYVTSELNDDFSQATVSAEITVQNATEFPVENVSLSMSILAPDGSVVASGQTALDGLQACGSDVYTETFLFSSPQLWAPENPVLYTLRCEILAKDGRVFDRYDTPFGVRKIAWTNEGFFLNGKRVQLDGMCTHQDHAGIGVAVPVAVHKWRLEQILKMGSNALRWAHNPFDPAVLDLCDRMGILVYAEQRKTGSSPELLGQLERMLRRDRNHPSIIIWGIGNEEKLVQQDDEMAKKYATPMAEKVRAMDKTRPITLGANTGAGGELSNIVDVQGYNYFLMMSDHERDNNGLTPDSFHKKFPEKPVFLSEESSNLWTRGQYQYRPERNALSAYDLPNPTRHWIPTMQASWDFIKARPWIAGAFMWTAIDYRGEPEFRWPSVGSFFGLMDSCGFPKDPYYFYQSIWADEPMMHVYPHWNWKPGAREIPLQVWTNLDEVTLQYNGIDYGKRRVNRGQPAEWRLQYTPGKLVVRGYKNGELVKETVIETTGEPARVALESDRPSYLADGLDTAMIKVFARDGQGRAVPDADKLIRFEIEGPAKIIGLGNGNPNSHEPDKASQRWLFNGLAQVIVQSDGTPGKVTLRALCDGLQTAELGLDFLPAPAPPRL